MFESSTAQALSCILMFATSFLSIEAWKERVFQLFEPQIETSICGNLPSLKPTSDPSPALPKLVIYKSEAPPEKSDSSVEVLLEKGRSGEFPVATNLASDPFLPYVPARRGGENSLLYNIESPIPLAISLSYQNQDDLLWDKKFAGDIFELTLFQIQSLPLFKSALTQVAAGENSSPMKSLIQKINEIQFISGFDFVTHEDLRKLLNRAYFIWDHAQTKSQFMTSLHKVVIEIANQRYLTEIGGKELPFYLDKEQRNLIYGPTDPSVTPAALHVGIEIRNRDYAKSILQLACAYRGSYDQIGVVISQEHVDGVTEKLRQATSSKTETLQVDRKYLN